MDFAPIVERVDHAMQEDDASMSSNSNSEIDSDVDIIYELEKLTQKNIGYPKKDTSEIRYLKDFHSESHFKRDDHGIEKTDLTGTYWLSFQNETIKSKFMKEGHLDCLTVLPKPNPMMPVASKPIHVL